MNSEEASQLCLRAVEDGPEGHEAKEKLLRGHQDMLFRFCLTRCRDRQIAMDATQEAALRMLNHLQRFDGQSKFSTWLLGIANNVCRELMRKDRRRKQNHSSDQIAETPANESESPMEGEYSATLQEAMNQLPERQREVVTLRYFEKLSVLETSYVMNVATGTVKATLNQAIKNLKKLFRDDS